MVHQLAGRLCAGEQHCAAHLVVVAAQATEWLLPGLVHDGITMRTMGPKCKILNLQQMYSSG
jgi:hypothetical protein